MNIKDFRVGTTKKFTVQCKLNEVLQDITTDTVTVRIKTLKSDIDASSLVEVAADVATDGANGNALFTITPAGTSGVAPGQYFIDIEWDLSGGDNYVIYDSIITLIERVSDP